MKKITTATYQYNDAGQVVQERVVEEIAPDEQDVQSDALDAVPSIIELPLTSSVSITDLICTAAGIVSIIAACVVIFKCATMV